MNTRGWGMPNECCNEISSLVEWNSKCRKRFSELSRNLITLYLGFHPSGVSKKAPHSATFPWFLLCFVWIFLPPSIVLSLCYSSALHSCPFFRAFFSYYFFLHSFFYFSGYSHFTNLRLEILLINGLVCTWKILAISWNLFYAGNWNSRGTRNRKFRTTIRRFQRFNYLFNCAWGMIFFESGNCL